MQFFWFFYTNKRTGVWGKAPDIKPKHKFIFDKIYLFQYTSNVVNMRSMFHNINNFNICINDWNVSNVLDMSYMFYGASKFNQPLDKWNVSNVKYMTCMFKNAVNFNQDLNTWKINNEADIKDMFVNTKLKPIWYIL